MKKILTITLLALLTVVLFVACNADAVATVLQRGGYAKFGDFSANFKSCGYVFSDGVYNLIFSEKETFSLESVTENRKWSLAVDPSLDGKTINSPSQLIAIMGWPDPSLEIKFTNLFSHSLGASELLEDYPGNSTYTASFKTTKSGNCCLTDNFRIKPTDNCTIL